MFNFPTHFTNHGGRINLLQCHRRKEKVVVVIGATGTCKSRLSIDLATRFAEIINSDKIQVYEGLDSFTSKVTGEECDGVPHHLLGTVDHAADFVYPATAAADEITGRGRMPAIVGGSNSIEELVSNYHQFRPRNDCGFIWEDVALPLLHSFISRRLEEKGREFFDPKGDYGWGIRPAIGVPELHEYLRSGMPITASRSYSFIKALGASAPVIRKWSIPGLTYEFGDEFPDAAKPAMLRAFASWEEPLNFTFSISLSAPGKADIRIGMFKGEHGDLHPFEAGPGGAHAHAAYPPHGEVHFNIERQWCYDLDPPPAGREDFIDFQSVAVHEIGHVLGIGHIDNPKAVMYKFIDPGQIRRGLTGADVAALKNIYSGDPNFD